MYNASQAFHDAVANGAHQIALLIFQDAVFTNDDINVDSGIEFDDYFNTNEDLTIGMALSNEISFSLFNDRRLLNNYEFGDFTATIGAQTGETAFSADGEIHVESADHVYDTIGTYPYLMRDGEAVGSAPSARVVSMMVHDGLVYCAAENGTVKVYKDSDGIDQSVTVSPFMISQMQKWRGKGVRYTPDTRLLKVWEGSRLRTYEFVPLGVFNAERPNVPSVNEIHFTCNDLMQRFETDMPSDAELGLTYPISFGNLFVRMCEYLNVPYRSSTFINSTATLSARPDDFDRVTMREVLQWLAEAAASVARFDRDGYLVMDWLKTTSVVIDEHGYKEFNPYWYETKQIDRLHNRATSGEFESIAGDGDEAYLIQDNPLLKGVT